MRSGLRLTFFAALLCWAAAGVGAVELLDDRPEVLSDYSQARKLLLDGQYLEASREFGQLAERYPDSKSLDLFVFNHAKAELYFGNRSDAIKAFADFINRFPGSALIAHAYFFEGNAYYLRAQVSKAVEAYIDAFRLSDDSRLDEMITDIAGRGDCTVTERQARRRRFCVARSGPSLSSDRTDRRVSGESRRHGSGAGPSLDLQRPS